MSKILFIDDDSSILALYEMIFKESQSLDLLTKDLNSLTQNERHGHNIQTVLGGERAIEYVKELITHGDKIDIAFIDMHMPPGIDGVETAAALRALLPQLEIVIVTAFSDIDLPQTLKRVHRIDKLLYLKKPFSPLEIIQIVNNISEKLTLQASSDRFLTNISHELKTPLASILGFSKILNEEVVSGTYQEMLNYIHQNAMVMEQLLSDLIETAKIQESQLILNVEELDLNEFLDQVISSFQLKNPESVILLDNRCPGILFHADAEHLTLGLHHLFSNAKKFSVQNLSITFRVTTDDSFLHFSIIDQGIGIDEKYHETIFRRFFRIEDQHHQIEGLGLGLYLCKKIISLHQGKIAVDSELGRGSCFTVTLPL